MTATGLLCLLAACIGVTWARLCLQHEKIVLQPLREAVPDPDSTVVVVGTEEMVIQKQRVSHEVGEDHHQPLFSSHFESLGDRLVSCPFYTHCCNRSFDAFQNFWTVHGTCCFNFVWCFTSASFLVIFFFSVSFAFWMNKRLKKRRARPSTGTDQVKGDNSMDVPMTTYTSPTSGTGIPPTLPAAKTLPTPPPPPLALAPPPYQEKAPGMYWMETQTLTTQP